MPLLFDEKLSGTSLGERQRQLNQLVKDSPFHDDGSSLEEWANSRCQAERMFLVRRAIHHKDARLLCQVLQSEDAMLVRTALHANWIYQDHAQLLLDHVFPNAPYSTVCRLISGLSVHLRNEPVAEHCFKELSGKFGQDKTLRLLRVCSMPFVREFIMQDLYIVPETILLNLYKRDTILVLDYLEKYIKESDNLEIRARRRVSYAKIWSIVAVDHAETYMRLFESSQTIVETRLSVNGTLKILKLYRDKIVKYPTKYLNILDSGTLMRTLKGDILEEFLIGLLPEQEKDFYFYLNFNSFLNYLKPAFAVKLFMKIYSKKYNSSLLNHKDFAHSDHLKHLPKDILIPWAREKLKDLKSANLEEIFVLKFIPPAEAIPRFKVLLGIAADAAARNALLEKMAECCVFHKNNEALLELLIFTAKRYRNELAYVRYNFLNKLRSSIKLHTLSLEHWNVIDEMIEFLCVSGEIKRNYWDYFLCEILEERLHFCLLHDLEIDTTIDKLIEYDCRNINLLKGVPEFEFVVLDKFSSKYKEIIEADPDSDSSSQLVLRLLSSYNNRSDASKHYATECDWLMEITRKYISDTDKRREYIHHFSSDVRGRKLFADEIFQCYDANSWLFDFLKHDSNVVLRNLKKFLDTSVQEHSIAKYSRMYRIIRTYMMNPLGESIEQNLRKIMTKEVKDDRKEAVIAVALCFLEDVEKVEDIVKKFIPVQTKVNIHKDQDQYLNSLIVAKMFQQMDPPVSFDTLLSFAKDDYLKHTLSSLLSNCFRKKPSDTREFIRELLTKPVSVKKHGIRLAYFLLPRSALLTLYKELWDAEKNSSIRDVLFQRTFCLMQTAENDEKYLEAWNQIKYYFTSFSETNVNLFPYLWKTEAVRLINLNDYCQTCWSVLKTLQLQKIDMDSGLASLSSSFTRYIEFLSEEFCESIIVEYLNSIDDSVNNQVSENLREFLVSYLIKAKVIEAQNKNIMHTCKIFEKYISDNWNKITNGEYKHRAVFSAFINSCCSQAISVKKEISPVYLLQSLINLLSSKLPFEAVFKYHISLNATILFHELLQDSMFVECANQGFVDSPLNQSLLRAFGQKVATYFNTLCNQYGTEIGPVFKDELENFVNMVVNYNEVKNFLLHLVSGIIDGKATIQCRLLAVGLLPEDVPISGMFAELCDRITSDDIPAVRIALYYKFDHNINLL